MTIFKRPFLIAMTVQEPIGHFVSSLNGRLDLIQIVHHLPLFTLCIKTKGPIIPLGFITFYFFC
jgi:hypothetical protein